MPKSMIELLPWMSRVSFMKVKLQFILELMHHGSVDCGPILAGAQKA